MFYSQKLNPLNHSEGVFQYDEPSAVMRHIYYIYTYRVYAISTCEQNTLLNIHFFFLLYVMYCVSTMLRDSLQT